MEGLEHSLFIVNLFNKIFSKPLSSLLALLGIKVNNPEHLVPDYIVMCLVVAVLLILASLLVFVLLQTLLAARRGPAP